MTSKPDILPNTNTKSSGITIQWHRISKTVNNLASTKNNTKHLNQSDDKNSSKKHILNNISGSARVGEVLALMGPSGSGKTSLLDVLSGRSSHDASSSSSSSGTNMDKTGMSLNSATTDGVFINSGITINGEVGTPVTLKKLRRRIAYVKQSDIFFQHLTVRDQLTFTAMLRLPKPKNKGVVSHDFYESAVGNIIALLRLEKCADSLIQMISGGERKRVNIGTELLTNPSVVILDEPTSGLDSTSAVSLMTLLQRLARSQNKTVISSIHQPSSAVFMERFDKVMMLADGNAVFYGTPSESLSYLNNIGLVCPSGYNAADHWMDVLVSDNSNTVDDIEEQDSPLTQCSKQKLIEAWDNENQCRKIATYDKELRLINKDRLSLRNITDNDPLGDPEYGSSWGTQLFVLTQRSLKNSRSAVFTWLNFVKSGLIGIIMGIIWFQMDYTEKTVNDRSAYYFFTMTFWVFDAMFMAFMAFPMEREIIFKERASGTYHLSAYFLAKTLSEAPTRLTLPLVYMTFSYWLAGLNNSFVIFLGSTACTLLSVFTGESIGLLVGASIFDFEKAMVIMTVIALGLMAVGGFFVENIPPFVEWIKYLSPFKYAFDASQQLTFDRPVPCDGSGTLEMYCFDNDSGYVSVSEVYEYLNIQGSVLFNVAILFVIAIVCRLGAYYALKSKKGDERM